MNHRGRGREEDVEKRSGFFVFFPFTSASTEATVQNQGQTPKNNRKTTTRTAPFKGPVKGPTWAAVVVYVRQGVVCVGGRQ